METIAGKEFGILWDYNGVIANDEHLQEKAVARVVGGYDVVINHEIYERECLGRSDKLAFENLKRLFPKIQYIPFEELMTAKTKIYLSFIESESILWPNLKNLFDELNEQFVMAIVTGSLRSEILPTLQKEGIIDLFKTIITADDLNQGKPNPEGYLKGAAVLNLPKENLVIIEDTPSGVQAAKAAGIKCIAVLHSVTADTLTSADSIIKNVSVITPGFIKKVLSGQKERVGLEGKRTYTSQK